MKNDKICNFMVAERKYRILKNQERIKELKRELDEDPMYKKFNKKLSILENRKRKIEKQIEQDEEKYNLIKNNNIITNLGLKIQKNADQIASLEEKRIMAFFMVETESKESRVPAILRNFKKYYEYKKRVNDEELHEYISVFTEFVPFLKLYNKVNEESEQLDDLTKQAKYSHLGSIYSFVQTQLTKDMKDYEDIYRKDNHFVISHSSVKRQYEQEISEIKEKEKPILQELIPIMARRKSIRAEIERLENENIAYMSQAEKLGGNIQDDLSVSFKKLQFRRSA